MDKEIIECNHGALARVCDRCEAENEKYRLAAEVERLRELLREVCPSGMQRVNKNLDTRIRAELKEER